MQDGYGSCRDGTGYADCMGVLEMQGLQAGTRNSGWVKRGYGGCVLKMWGLYSIFKSPTPAY